MAEIQGSIPANEGAPQPNPLGMAGQIIGLRNALLTGQQQQQALQQGQIGINTSQYELAMKHYQGLSAFFSQYYARDHLTKADMIKAGADAVNAGLADPGQVSTELASMPDDNAGIHDHLKQLIFSANDAATRLQAIAPTPTLVNTGGQIEPKVIPQVGPITDAGKPIPLTLPPTTTTVGPNNQPMYLGGAAGGGNAGQPSQGAAGSPSPSGAPGTVPAGLAPGTGPYMEAAGSAAAALVNNDFPTQRGLLQNVAAETQAIPSFAFGPGSGLVHEGLKWFQELGGGKKEELGAEQAAALDAFVKNTGQLATALLPTIGNSSDRSQIAAMAQNPGLFLSKRGAQRIESLLQGSLDAAQYKVNQFQASRTPPGNYFDWNTNFNKTFDTRVFQWPYMSKAQRDETAQEMGGYNSPRFAKFRAYYNQVRDQGGITIPGQ